LFKKWEAFGGRKGKMYGTYMAKEVHTAAEAMLCITDRGGVPTSHSPSSWIAAIQPFVACCLMVSSPMITTTSEMTCTVSGGALNSTHSPM